ncbi:M56 family metallopeptidase [Agathobaculum sp.]|uniref:M56 family metallopeptidase n=1 Tax=Agathobaculum sp. TaxID=2048138 RepID=UPI002A802A10|nr:M56 family metallopeptidase [Agathobaculum sp.]MDY3618745.1 M56 family metallopeptidase [Agathobaculum sp.]
MRFSLILQWSLAASAVAGLLLLVKWLFREHLTAKWHYLVWLILLARLVIPPWAAFMPASTLGVQSAADVGKAAKAISGCAGQALSGGRDAAVPVVHLGGGCYERLYEVSGARLPGWTDTLDRVLFWVWAAGAAALLLYLLALGLWLTVRARRYPKAGAAFAARAAGLMGRVCAGNGPEPVRVRLAPDGDTPYVCGAFLPVLVVPAIMADTLDDKVLLHELVHIVRHDVLKNYVFMAFRCLHWFNPFLWRVFGGVSDDCETACDECVLELLDPEEHIAYGRALLDMVQPRFRYRMGTSCIANGASNIRRRIVRVTRHKEISGRARGMSAVLFCLLAWMCLTGPQAQAVRWGDPGMPDGDVSAYLQRAGRYRVSDLNEALYLYGKSFALDNGYYRYIVADDDERERLTQVFSANQAQGGLPWAFDGETVDWEYLAAYGTVERSEIENLDYESWSIAPAFGVYNVRGTRDGGTATILYPLVRIAESDGSGASVYRYDRVRVIRQDGRYVVQSVERGQANVSGWEWDYPLDDSLFVYRAQDKNFDYEARVIAGQTYAFYGYQKQTGVWQEQADPAADMFGWSRGGVLPMAGKSGLAGQMFIRPKQGVQMLGVLGVAGSPEPLSENDVPETDPYRVSSTSSEFGKFIRWGCTAVLGEIEPGRDGWYPTGLMNNGVFQKNGAPQAFYLRTQLNGGEIADLSFRIVSAGEEAENDGANG